MALAANMALTVVHFDDDKSYVMDGYVSKHRKCNWSGFGAYLLSDDMKYGCCFDRSPNIFRFII